MKAIIPLALLLVIAATGSAQVVISEIHYHPEPDGFEFVELLNLTASPVALFSAAFPTNAWKLSGPA